MYDWLLHRLPAGVVCMNVGAGEVQEQGVSGRKSGTSTHAPQNGSNFRARPFLFLSFPPRPRVRQHASFKLQHKTKRIRVPITSLPTLDVSMALILRSCTTPTDTKPRPRGNRTLSFLAHFSLPFACFYLLYSSPSLVPPRSPLL